MKARYQQVETHRQEHPVELLCRLLGISRSGYYNWRRRVPSRRQREDAQLIEQIRKEFKANRGVYGRPRMTRQLQAQGWACGQRRVGRLMKQGGLKACIRKKRRKGSSESEPRELIAPNYLAKRQAPPERVNEVWVADMTYIGTHQGWLYMAAIMDLYSRRIVGWALSTRQDSELVTGALRMAITHRRPKAGLLHHSDQGGQYTSKRYRRSLKANGMKASMSARANPYDNAAMESFFSTLKKECVRREAMSSRVEARLNVIAYVETFYNPRRLHSALDYKSPVDFETLTN